MPHVEKLRSISDLPSDAPAASIGQQIDLVTGFLWRRYKLILACLILALPFGWLYLYVTPASYTASATMLIETRQSPLQQTMSRDPAPDAAWIESQLGVLRSQNVAAYVVRQLRLADDPEFTRPETGLLEKIRARLGWAEPPPSTEAERAGQAIGKVSGGLEARRLGSSYMMQIDFRSQNPTLAIKVANAMIDGYIFEQLNAKYQANRRAGDWLQERLQTLREQTSAAERAVLEFKAKNNIVATGGSLMSDQRLSEISNQLGTARAQAGELQVRLERIQAVRQAYQQDQPAAAADETVIEATSSGIINSLRTRYLELVNREADYSARYGHNHGAVITLRNQIRELRRSMRDELGRIEQTFKSELEIAKKRQDQLEKNLATLVSQSTETSQAKIALFSLEAQAQSYRKIYDSFLQQHTESVQQQSFPISDARPLSSASVRRTGPNTLQTWMVTILAGGMLGVGLGAVREIRDRGFRTREQVQSVLNTECLALVPMVADKKSKSLRLPRKALPAPGEYPRGITSDARILRTIVDAPWSPYAEAIRSLKLTIDLNSHNKGKPSKVIGLTSALPSEGKSTVAAATAALMAQGGSRVLLVDCDLRNPSLSRAMTPHARAGFLDVVAGKVPLADVVWIDPKTNMSFLPMVPNRHLPNATEMLCSAAARSLFAALEIRYDYVVVDLAPLVAAIDARVATRLIDSYVLVIEWGSTKIDAVQYALRHTPGVQQNMVGVVLNKVDMATLNQYDSYGGADYYNNYGQTRQAIQ